HREPIEDFLERRKRSFEKLKSVIPKGMDICLGAEVYVTDILYNNRDISSLCYGNSNYILLEFPYAYTFRDRQYDSFMRLVSNYRVRPVLAHIERYGALMSSKDTMRNLISSGVLFQTNAVSYSEHFLKRKLLKYMKNGFVDLLGSDCHNMVRNSPENYAPAKEIIIKKNGEHFIRKINSKSEMIFNSSL
ncbi:MAG: CpsB/CapC family capsule biosynthesis tyrosine phosphatase, partial [Acutalibacteraceae bacterium]